MEKSFLLKTILIAFLLNILVTPGMLLQRLTTREPDNSQIEVALRTLKSVI